MNYNKIFARGSNYVNLAGSNWTSRKDKFIRVWCRMQSNEINGDGGRIGRVSNIIKELEERISKMTDLWFLKERERKIKETEAGNMWVELDCDDGSCRLNPNGIGVAVRYKDYEEDKYFCETCGGAMKMREDRHISDLLMSVGVQY